MHCRSNSRVNSLTISPADFTVRVCIYYKLSCWCQIYAFQIRFYVVVFLVKWRYSEYSLHHVPSCSFEVKRTGALQMSPPPSARTFPSSSSRSRKEIKFSTIRLCELSTYPKHMRSLTFQPLLDAIYQIRESLRDGASRDPSKCRTTPTVPRLTQFSPGPPPASSLSLTALPLKAAPPKASSSGGVLDGGPCRVRLRATGALRMSQWRGSRCQGPVSPVYGIGVWWQNRSPCRPLPHEVKTRWSSRKTALQPYGALVNPVRCVADGAFQTRAPLGGCLYRTHAAAQTRLVSTYRTSDLLGSSRSW